ncbi:MULTISPECIES: DUF4401 domain-containing protein [unclassified Halomonas]|uniref:DUF4401 domain-containing protein n=1 Tax=unclassified Halomonas TaxID=2609666 RepID=UPI0006DA219A|nr:MULTISPECIES: DUF4401 domain-containing protein [unclassified Halomonas]KPQ20676.1 MAG: protein of unknown function containing DUF4401 domain [Halomonas sp. HL-93]SBR50777.1 protein of unknown function (DUF4401) [Halomonas sp. HL-93]SNY97029.1 protein of unknown function [Halomonas sp. hl-4]
MRKTSSLSARLYQAGIEVNERPHLTPETPWFVRALQAFSGWLAALFLLGFLAIGAVSVMESALGSLSLGFIMLAGAFALFRVSRSDVAEHLALAISLAGQLLVAWALVDVWLESAYVWYALVGLQCLLALVMPSQVHRSFSAFTAGVALYMALESIGMASVASGVVLLALTVLWVNEFRWPTRIKHVQAWGYGLLLSLLVNQGFAHSGQALSFVDDNPVSALVWLMPWLNAALVALALLLLFRTRFQSLSFRARWAAYAGAGALLIVSYHVPSVGQGVVVVLLGFAIGHRVLVGLGVLSLLLGIGSYYYWLDATLLIKALTLLVVGVLLLGLRWALRQWLSSPIDKSGNGSVDHDA